MAVVDNAKDTVQHATQQVNRVHHHVGSSPIILSILGVAVLFLWLMATIVQIQTSEFLALGSRVRVGNVSWSVLQQPYLLITGQAPVSLATAWMYGLTVEIITLVFALALSVAITKIKAANPWFSKWFVLGGLALIILNSWADYSASPGSSPLVQVLIAVALGGIAVVGLPLGIGLIEHAVKEV